MILELSITFCINILESLSNNTFLLPKVLTQGIAHTKAAASKRKWIGLKMLLYFFQK